MPTKTKLEISSFTKGLVTEASPLTFPDSASLSDVNFILNKDGSRKRRLGMDYEAGAVEYTHEGAIPSATGVAMLLWKNPTQTGEFDIVVVQTGNKLRFFKASEDSVSPEILNGGAVYTISGFDASVSISSASLRGQLILTVNQQKVVLLKYNSTTDTVTSEDITLKVRDVFGITPAWAVDYRPAYALIVPAGSDTDAINHTYNLRNQGWPRLTEVVKTPTGASVSGSAISTTDPTIITDDGTNGRRVSNADVLWRARTTIAESPDAVGAYSTFELVKQEYGNTPAPKGRAIIDIFNRSTSRQAFYNVIEARTDRLVRTDISTGAITDVAAYAGRFFYAVKETSLTGGDSQSPKLSTMIFFSQVVKSTENIGNCYAEADPSSEHVYDPIATDGGFIVIPDAGDILQMTPMGNSLFVFCSNGVWEIHGGEEAFSATNQNVTRTTSIGAISAKSVVLAETALFYWAASGIYAITLDPGSLRGVPMNISVNTIQKEYEAILDRTNALGIYDEVDRKVRWLGNRSLPSFVPDVRYYNYELVFDVDLRAFYTNSIPIVETVGYELGVASVIARPRALYLLGKFTEFEEFIFSFGTYKNTDFKDFNILDAQAILITGYLTGGTGSLDKQVKSLVIHCNRTEKNFVNEGGSLVFDNPSGCLVTTMWEWTDNPIANRWGAPYQAYRLTVPYYPAGPSAFSYGYTVITSKTGIRGKGKALSIKFESEEGKDLHLLGWGLEIKVDDNY